MVLKLKENQKVYFTSDPHFFHKNICRGISNWKDAEGNRALRETRDFETLEEMNETLIENINKVVKENDYLFCLGDWSFGDTKNIWEARSQINCKNIILIYGNHDTKIRENRQLSNLQMYAGMGHTRLTYAQEVFSSVHDYLKLEIDDKTLILSHYPIDSWENMNKGSIHLHGHVHLPPEKKLGKGKRLDVGVDGNNLEVYSLEEIIEIMKNKPIKSSLGFDHHEKEIR